MEPLAQKKLIEYKKRFIKKLGYVVEVGSFDMEGGNRHLFEDADDFCGIDCKRGPGVDIVTDCAEIDRLFDFNPYIIICLDIFSRVVNKKKIIKAVRETLMPGGYLMVFVPQTGEGSCIDALFNGYKVLDLTTVNRTICGIARKPYKI